MKFRLHVPVTIIADDAAAVVNARLKLEKAIAMLVLDMNRTRGSAVLTADFSFKMVEEAAKKTGG